MEEPKIDKIDDFESLADYSKTNPAAELPPDDPVPDPARASDSNEFPTTQDAGGAEPPMGGSEFSNAVTGAQNADPMALDGLADAAPGGAPSPQGALAGIDQTGSADLGPPSDAFPAADAFPPADAAPVGAPPADAFAADTGADSSFAVAATAETPAPSESPAPPEPPAPPPPPVVEEPQSQAIVTPPPAPPGPPSTPMQKIKQFSEKLAVGNPAVAAAYPFSLLITGKLAPEEKEKLLDLISRENMGFREVDLEPQFESDRVLIPRISEFAGVLLIQALRGTRAQVRFAPSDQIFSSAETRDSENESVPGTAADQASVYSSEVEHPAERLPLTAEGSLPNLPQFVVVDAVTASAALRTQVVEAESSSEYQEILEALQRELKYKAYRKGATAVVKFTVNLNTLSMPTHYRITAMGSAVRPPSAKPEAAPPQPVSPTPAATQPAPESAPAADPDATLLIVAPPGDPPPA